MTATTLVAGIGNVFFSDDGFGVEVATRLAKEGLPDGVRVMDAGIRARHLAYELLDGGCETAILVDTVRRGGPPGTLYLLEPEPSVRSTFETMASLDGHTMTPDAILAFVKALGGSPTRILIVGCEPACVDEGMGLTPPVGAAVEHALALIRTMLNEPGVTRQCV